MSNLDFLSCKQCTSHTGNFVFALLSHLPLSPTVDEVRLAASGKGLVKALQGRSSARPVVNSRGRAAAQCYIQATII